MNFTQKCFFYYTIKYLEDKTMKINTNYTFKMNRTNHQTFGKNTMETTGLHMDTAKISREIGAFPGSEAQRVEGQLRDLAKNCEVHVTPISSLMIAPELDRAVVTVLPKGAELKLKDKLKIRFGRMGQIVDQVNHGFGDRLIAAVKAGKKALSLV